MESRLATRGKNHSVELKVEEILTPLRAFFLEANEFDSEMDLIK